MIAAQWYFFRQNTRYSMLSFLYLCLFIMVFALLMFFLYKIFKYLKDNEYICKTVQKKSKRARPDLEPVEFLSTELDRPVWLFQPDRIGRLKFLT